MNNGKITIDYEGLKREFALPFQICLGRQELYALYLALQKEVEGEKPFVYGWIDVPLSGTHSVNQKPIGWSEGEND